MQKEPGSLASQYANLLLRSKAVQKNYEQFFNYTFNFDQKEPTFLTSQCTTLLLHRTPVQRNHLHFFKEFKQKFLLYRLMRLRLLVKMLLMEIMFGVKVTMNIATKKKPCSGYFTDFWPVFWALDREILISTFFEHFLVSSYFTQSAAFF